MSNASIKCRSLTRKKRKLRRGHIHVTQTCRQKSVISTIKNKMNSIDNTKNNKNDDYNNNKTIIVTIIIKLIVAIIIITTTMIIMMITPIIIMITVSQNN